jgi:lysophospholipase L1-like esterase
VTPRNRAARAIVRSRFALAWRDGLKHAVMSTVGRGLGKLIAGLGVAVTACLLAGTSAGGPGVAHADPAQVLIVGDSLAVGMRPFLGDMITDRQVTFDVRAGWTTPQGMEALRLDLTQYAPQTIVISLGTNDGSDADIFADRVRRILRALPPYSCVVWPAIIRPKRKGAYEGLNRVLRTEARRDRRLTVVDWDRMVALGLVALRDGIHPDVDGYRWRAWVTAGAVKRGCDAGG